jgi:tRNA U34 5-methylaminomethyl-2-thiouridine-forming methyltransferase MnmC
VTTASGYELVRLANGGHAVFSHEYGEKMHPGLGPVEEAETVHIRQLKIPERLQRHSGAFVVWDIGLGAAANALALLRMTRKSGAPVQLVSFDDTLEPLSFALGHTTALSYMRGYESAIETVLKHHRTKFKDGERTVDWVLHVGDFPDLLRRREVATIPAPHAIMFDPFSPARNPAMWTLAVFENLFRLLDPSRPCSLTTYSRSTMIRVTLLLAGFFVGFGRPAGLKEETTVAANALDLLDAPLDGTWLRRARNSSSAEPLNDPTFRRCALSAATWERLCGHRQFRHVPRSVPPRSN